MANERRAFGFSPFNVEGPMGREAQDARLLLAAMAGPQSFDPLSQRRDPGFDAPGLPDLSRLRIAVSEDLGFCPIDNGVRATFRARMARMATFFHATDEACPDLSSVERVLQVMRSLEFLHDFKAIYDRDKASLAPNVVYEVERALTLGITDAAWALGEHARIHRAAQAFFDRYDLLFTPAASVPPFRHEDEWPRQINGQPMANYLQWEAIAYGVTLMGNPAVVIPCGKGPDGLPFGLQIVGPLHRDALLADVAVVLDALFAREPDLCRPMIDLPALIRAAADKKQEPQQERTST